MRETLLGPEENAIKRAAWLVWLVSLGAAAFGSGWVATLGRTVFFITLGAHLVEFFVYRKVLVQVGGSMGHHFVQTLIYGLFHVMPLKRQVAEASAARKNS